MPLNEKPDALLEINDLEVSYASGRGQGGDIRAVAGLSLAVNAGQSVGLVGESGCGKSTLARTIVGLEQPSSGSIWFAGERLDTVSRRRRRELTTDIQMIYQDPYSSLNPRKTVEFSVAEGWRTRNGSVPKKEWPALVRGLLSRVGLSEDIADRYPHELSGGQRQRIGIARALALRPRLMVCDEPVSALDVSVQSQALNLFQDLQRDFGLSYLFISHDLAVVRHMSTELTVMYLGKIVETGATETIYNRPAHPYTAALLSGEPSPRPWREKPRERIILTGEMPSPAAPPSGCRFRTRCFMAQAICAEKVPELRMVDGRRVACHFAEDSLSRQPNSIVDTEPGQ